MQDIIVKLRKMLTDAVLRNRASGSLFSGGLDSAILAGINTRIKAITVSLNSNAEDIGYAALTAEFLNLEHIYRGVSVDEALAAIPEAIRILETFDPAIPNDLAVYFGIKKAKELGIKEVMTGDGSDELFAGYSYMQEIDDLGGYIQRIAKSMEFSSNRIAEFFDIKIKQPFIDKALVNFALEIGPHLKIKEQDGRIWGKWILRKAFEGVLPDNIIWQGKRPLEYGSGMVRLRDIISEEITDEEFRDNSYPVKFMNKEHLYYYKVYMKEIGQIPGPKNGEKPCPGCGAGMDTDSSHCRVCGNICGGHN